MRIYLLTVVFSFLLGFTFPTDVSYPQSLQEFPLYIRYWVQVSIPETIEYRLYCSSVWLNECRSRRDPVLGKSKAEVLRSWGKPFSIRLATQDLKVTSNAERVISYDEGYSDLYDKAVDMQIECANKEKEEWSYNGFSFEIKNSECVGVGRTYRW